MPSKKNSTKQPQQQQQQTKNNNSKPSNEKQQRQPSPTVAAAATAASSPSPSPKQSSNTTNTSNKKNIASPLTPTTPFAAKHTGITNNTTTTTNNNTNNKDNANSRAIAKWTVIWFIFACLAASLLLAAEAFQDYRPAFPLEPVCATAFLLHVAAALVTMRIGFLRWYPHFALWQPFSGGLPFVATQILGYTCWAAATLTLYLYFSVGYSRVVQNGDQQQQQDASSGEEQLIITSSFAGVSDAFKSLYSLVMPLVEEDNFEQQKESLSSSSTTILHQIHGPLAVAGILSAAASWFLFISLQYFGVSSQTNHHHHHHHHQHHKHDAKNNTDKKKTRSMASNESRAAVVMLAVQLFLTAATQWHHERHYDDAAQALGLILLISHVLTAVIAHFVVGYRLIPTFRWFMPFHGSIRDVLPQALAWTAFSTSILGFRVMMLSPDHAADLPTNINKQQQTITDDGDVLSLFQQQEGGRIGWGAFGAVGVAANIGLLLQMRLRVREYFEEEQKLIDKDARSFQKLRSLVHHSHAPPPATYFLAKNTRYVLTLTSVFIAIFGILTSSPFIEKWLYSITGIPPRSWFLAFRILLQCQISFPVVTHITGVVLRAYNVRNPFASGLAGSEFVILQLGGWSAFVAAIIFGLVLSPTMTPHQVIIADQWTSCLALLAQILIGTSVSLLDRKTQRAMKSEFAVGNDIDESTSSSTSTSTSSPAQSPTTDDQQQQSSTRVKNIKNNNNNKKQQQQHTQSTFQVALASLPVRGMDEMFNGLFLTGLVGNVLSILLRIGCDIALQLSSSTSTSSSSSKQHPQQEKQQQRQADIPIPVLVTFSTLIWAVCVPLLQFSIVGFNRPFQGSPLFAALQSLGWATYLFVLVLLSLASVDFLEESSSSPSSVSKNNSLQFTSQGALMIIPVFLITTSAFFSNKFDGAADDEETNNNNNNNDDDNDIVHQMSDDDEQEQEQEQTDSQLLSPNDLEQLRKLKDSSSTSDALKATLENLLLAQQQNTNNKVKNQNNTKNINNNINRSASPPMSNLFRQLRHSPTSNTSPSSRKDNNNNNKGNDLAATIIFVACLSIASLSLFVAAEHLGNSKMNDLRPVHVTVLGVAAILASTLGCGAAHFLIGPTLHGSKVYRYWMPFQGGTSFVSWQVTGFGSLATAFLLLCVDLTRRYQTMKNINNNNSDQQHTMNNSTSTTAAQSSLVPPGILSGLAPLIVLCSTFAFDKTRTALDQPGSTLYENAEATLSLVVLGGSWFLSATSELWLQSEWELATIPLFFGSISGLVVMPIAVIAIRKSSAQARFRKSDVIDDDSGEADENVDEDEESGEADEEENENENDDFDEEEEFYEEPQFDDDGKSTSSKMTKRKRPRNDSFHSRTTTATSVLSKSSSKRSRKTTKTQKFAMGIASTFTTLTNAPVILLEVVFLMLCGALPMGFIYSLYYLYNNYKTSATVEIVSGLQTTTGISIAILAAIFFSYYFLRAFTATMSAFMIYSVPLFLLSFVASFPLTRPYNSGAWWMLVELVLGIVPPLAIQPILTLFDAASLGLCVNHAYRLWRSKNSAVVMMSSAVSASTTSTSLILTPLSFFLTPESTITASAYVNMFLGQTALAALENALYFSILLLYKQRFLRAPETTGELRSTTVLGGLQKWIIPGATRYFNLKVLVHGVDHKTGLKAPIRYNTTRSDLKLLPIEGANSSNNTDKFYKSWAKKSINQKQPSVQKAVFGYAPHGIFAFTVPWLAISVPWLTAGGGSKECVKVDEVKDIEKDYHKRNNEDPAKTNTYYGVLPRIVVPFAANIVFSVPTMRDCAMWFGGRAATRSAIGHALKYPKMNSNNNNNLPDGLSCCIVPGGQAELIESRSNTKCLNLIGYHFGFLKMAVQNRTCPAPIMGFGENDVLDNVHVPKVQRFFLNRAGFPFPILPLGFLGFTWLPKKVRLTPVVGRPVDIEAVWREEVKKERKRSSSTSTSTKNNDNNTKNNNNDDDNDDSWPAPNSEDEMALVKAVAKYYYQELMRIFYGYREEAGYGGMDLNIYLDKQQLKQQGQ